MSHVVDAKKSMQQRVYKAEKFSHFCAIANPFLGDWAIYFPPLTHEQFHLSENLMQVSSAFSVKLLGSQASPHLWPHSH